MRELRSGFPADGWKPTRSLYDILDDVLASKRGRTRSFDFTIGGATG